jgi:hypothetical protein
MLATIVARPLHPESSSWPAPSSCRLLARIVAVLFGMIALSADPSPLVAQTDTTADTVVKRDGTWREITVAYRRGYEIANYLEETIYEQTEEALLNHALNATVRYRQRWGSISSRFIASHYLHDWITTDSPSTGAPPSTWPRDSP